MAVPDELRLVKDMEVFRYVTLLCLLRQRELRLISVWHPSFLTLLVDALSTNWQELLTARTAISPTANANTRTNSHPLFSPR